MPAVRFIAFEYYTLLTSSITCDSEIMSSCSYYMKKGLVYIIITEPSSRQPSSCFKYIKANTCLLYNMRSVSLNKCIFFTHFASL